MGAARAGAPAKLQRKRSPLEEWAQQPNATGNWFGVRDSLAGRGIEIEGGWRGAFYGITSGGMDSPRGAFDEELWFGMRLDFGALAGIDGLTAQATVRWRDGRDPNTYVGASSTFSPSRTRSGLGWRLMPVTLTYTTPELVGVPHFLTISGGWQNAYTIFADQPLSKLFVNNAISATKGIGGVNGFPWSSSYEAWGGYMKVQPTEWIYTMAGLYVAVPDAAATANHGVDFDNCFQARDRNGIYFLAETGVTPRIGPDALPGKYAFGTIYWGVENESFFGATYDQKITFYWQADQMLFREKKDADEGLSVFTFLNYAPQYDNGMPFYFHAGVVYRGLIPGRDRDLAGIAFGCGTYSIDKLHAAEAANEPMRQTMESVVEADYRIALTKSAFVQPFWQFILRPGGTGTVGSANILGLQFGVDF
jgi:Carbohydrate-selective porin